MNKNQMLQICKEELAVKRAKAQNLAYNNLLKARQDASFVEAEKRQRDLIFQIGKLKAFGKTNKDVEKELNQIKEIKAKALENLGLKEEDLYPKYSCKLCDDIGYKNGIMCECLRQKLNNMITMQYGSGKDHLADFKEFNASLAVNEEHKKQLLKLKKKFEDLAKTYPESSPKFIIVSGKTGVGKTFITECLAKALIDRDFLVSFITAFGMNNLFLSYHTTFDEQKQSYLNALIDPDVLVIDDLGTEPLLKKVTVEYLYLILTERSRLNKLTIVTTNLTPNDILARYNERIFSRLCNKRESFLYNIVGQDLRLAPNPKDNK